YVSSLFFCVLVVVYLVATWRYLSPGAAVAAAMLMLTRIPDVLQEMRTGERTTATNMRRNGLDYVTTALMWLALPVLCLTAAARRGALPRAGAPRPAPAGRRRHSRSRSPGNERYRGSQTQNLSTLSGGEGRESNPPGTLRSPDWF